MEPQIKFLRHAQYFLNAYLIQFLPEVEYWHKLRGPGFSVKQLSTAFRSGEHLQLGDYPSTDHPLAGALNVGRKAKERRSVHIWK